MAAPLSLSSNNPSSLKKRYKVLYKSLQYTHLSLQMVAIIGAGVWLGMQLDAYLQLAFPVFMSILAPASTTYAVYAVIKTFVSNPSNNA
jgi:Putative F0F1-ATPase subunit Ca2+/Mg2+ transporter